MSHHDLSHLNQGPLQDGWQQVQDDEALLLYAICRVHGVRRVIEFGGCQGYSARNFVAAVDYEPGGTVYSVDIVVVPTVAPNHVCINKSAADVTPEDFHSQPADLVFFDCHDYHASRTAFDRLVAAGIITDDTLLALHDTGTFDDQRWPWFYPLVGGGYGNHYAERRLACDFRDYGYQRITFHTKRPIGPMRGRYGLTVCAKPQPMPYEIAV